jgi:RimJ/RimL family protein N-acetyltransferase
MIQIREIRIEDARKFLSMKIKMDSETKFMLLEPGERRTSLEEQEKQIAQMLSRPNQMVFLAEDDGELVGSLSAQGGLCKRNQHCVYIVVGILKSYCGKGIGTALFTTMEAWARRQGIHRLELTVMKHNQAGVHLYKKMGFEVEGVLVHSIQIDGEYIDQYSMAKLLL